MPAKNSRKIYVPDAYYHVYNRGVEKRTIFCDDQDYEIFLKYLKTYLLPKDESKLLEKLSDPLVTWTYKNRILKDLKLNNFSKEINLLAYCLMPNHFHMLLHQKEADSIDKFMNSLNTRYVMFFNRKYKRVGHLFQGVYKAVRVKTDEQLLYLSAYIHRNPLANNSKKKNLSIEELLTQPSSMPEYLGLRNSDWISKSEVLSHFSKIQKGNSYKRFILNQKFNYSPIGKMTLD